ncbi:MAG: hypothetical protein GY950_19545, partial [bacterium]|nr:hypothetical protein [bacterium]
TNERLSQHLRSRMEVGTTLSRGKITAIRLRAAIIIGTGSTSYELLKSMILHNRWIPFFPELDSWCQPIAIRDVIKYLVGVLEAEGLKTGSYPIGGKEVIPYRHLILRVAKILNKKVRFFDVAWVPIPVTGLCRIYAYWLAMFISIPVNITSLSLDSLRTDVVCMNSDLVQILPFQPLGFDA